MIERIFLGLAFIVLAAGLAAAAMGQGAVALILLCATITLLPTRFDPAIRIKEWQIDKGIHPESAAMPQVKPIDEPNPVSPQAYTPPPACRVCKADCGQCGGPITEGMGGQP